MRNPSPPATQSRRSAKAFCSCSSRAKSRSLIRTTRIRARSVPMSADPDHPHTGGHDHDRGQQPPPVTALRVKALESLLVEKGLVDPAALDALIDYYETKVGPRNVARAWTDPAYKA